LDANTKALAAPVERMKRILMAKDKKATVRPPPWRPLKRHKTIKIPHHCVDDGRRLLAS
jgi:hypothetical protein